MTDDFRSAVKTVRHRKRQEDAQPCNVSFRLLRGLLLTPDERMPLVSASGSRSGCRVRPGTPIRKGSTAMELIKANTGQQEHFVK